MKLNTLKLPSAIISSLYHKTLVTTGVHPFPKQEPADVIETGIKEEVIAPAKEKIKFLGENRKNILIAVDYKNVPIIPDEDLSFLTNMLTACKLTLADVIIVNLNTVENTSYKAIFESFSSDIVLLFGPAPSSLQLPVSFPHFQVQSFNKYTFLFTPSLSEIQSDKILKSKLWVCLRRIFNV